MGFSIGTKSVGNQEPLGRCMGLWEPCRRVRNKEQVSIGTLDVGNHQLAVSENQQYMESSAGGLGETEVYGISNGQ